MDGDIKAGYAPLKRIIAIAGVSVPAHDALWLPVNVPLMAGPLCKDCSAFGNADHLVYATAELTAMEYENGVLAMEFSAPAAGEVVLQLSREPVGPFVAGGRTIGVRLGREGIARAAEDSGGRRRGTSGSDRPGR